MLFDGNNAVDNVFLHSPPWQGTEIFLVMQFNSTASASHKGVGNGFVCNGEFELIGLDRSPVAVSSGESGLYDLAFVGLEQISFVYYEIEFSGLYSFSEDKVEFEVYECSQGQGQNEAGYGYYFTFACHDSFRVKKDMKLFLTYIAVIAFSSGCRSRMWKRSSAAMVWQR